MTWEPIENLERAKDVIKEFHKLQPNKPRAKELRKLEIPIHLFPTHLLRPIPSALTEPVPRNQPTEILAMKLARNGVRALRGG